MQQRNNHGPGSIFRFGWLGDGATIQCMPQLNMLVMFGDVNPVVVSICDCINHMSEGGKKDATYIAEMFQEKVNDFDHKGRHTGPNSVSNLS